MPTTESPDLTDEENSQQAGLLAQVNTWCKLAASSAALSDDYEKERFEELLGKSKKSLSELTDPFYACAARHFIINALCKAQRTTEAAKLLLEIEDEFIVTQVLEDNPSLADEPAFVALRTSRNIHALLKGIRSDVDDLSSRDPVDIESIEDRLTAIEDAVQITAANQNEMSRRNARRLLIVIGLLVVVLLLLVFK